MLLGWSVSELPKNWVTTKLDNLAEDISYGHTASSTTDQVGPHFLRITDIQANAVSWKSVPYCKIDERQAHKYILKEGDLVFARTGATVGKSFLIRKPLPVSVFASYLIRVRCLIPSTSNYLAHYFRSHDYWQQITEFSAGIGQPNVNGSKLKELKIPLPPLEEQTRITSALDGLLAQVDTLKDRLDDLSPIMKNFRQSVLCAAVSGQLTSAWRTDTSMTGSGRDVIATDASNKQKLLRLIPELAQKKSSKESQIDSDYIFEIPESWEFTTWGEIAEWITYGFTRPMPKSEAGTKLATAKDVQNFSINLDHCGFTTNEAFEKLSEKDKPHLGDLLITKDGTIGRAALVRSDESFCINQSVASCWLRSTSMNKNYLELLANSDFTQKFVRDKAQGMAIQHLSIIDFAKCPVPTPPSAEQDEIVRRVEQLFAFADQLEARLTDARQRVDALTQSILAKAFRGELVPQDPNDEPASVLLERIAAQRAADPKPKRGRAAKASS